MRQFPQALDLGVELLFQVGQRCFADVLQTLSGDIRAGLDQLLEPRGLGVDCLLRQRLVDVQADARQVAVWVARGHVLSVGVQQQADHRLAQVTACLAMPWAGAIDDVDQFQKAAAGWQGRVLDHGQRGVAEFAVGDLVHRAGDQRVVPGQELGVFVRQRGGAVVGQQQAVVGDLWKGTDTDVFAMAHHQSSGGVFLGFHAEQVEAGFHEGRQALVPVEVLDAFDQRRAGPRVERGQREQAITAPVHPLGQLFVQARGGVQDGLPIAVVAGQGRVDAFAHLRIHGRRRRVGVGEAIRAASIPRQPARVAGVGDRDMDTNGLALADAVEATDALFQQIGVCRQVEENQVMGELKIASLAADLGAQQDLGAVLRIGEPRGRAITLDDAHALVEGGATDAVAMSQRGLQRLRGGGAGADQQQLGRTHLADEFTQPGGAWLRLFLAGLG